VLAAKGADIAPRQRHAREMRAPRRRDVQSAIRPADREIGRNQILGVISVMRPLARLPVA
jgi:hypothetical protein